MLDSSWRAMGKFIGRVGKLPVDVCQKLADHVCAGTLATERNAALDYCESWLQEDDRMTPLATGAATRTVT